MGIFSKPKKIRIGEPAFVAYEAKEAAKSGPSIILELARAARIEIKCEKEASYFAAFFPLLAMCFAGLEDDVRRAYGHYVSTEFENQYGLQAGDDYLQRCMDYLAAADKDIADGKLHLLPTLLTQALNNICGVSDESVVMFRLGLVKTAVPIIKNRAEFYRDLELF